MNVISILLLLRCWKCLHCHICHAWLYSYLSMLHKKVLTSFPLSSEICAPINLLAWRWWWWWWPRMWFAGKKTPFFFIICNYKCKLIYFIFIRFNKTVIIVYIFILQPNLFNLSEYFHRSGFIASSVEK